MAKRTPNCVGAFLCVVIAGAACSSDRPDAPGNRSTGSGDDRVTVEGCLTGGPDGRLVLTAAPDPGVTAPARVGMGERDTHSYVLVGGSNLQQHIGKRLEVSGTLVGRRQELEREAKTESQGTPTGTSGGRTPTVETREEVDLEVRQLTVADVRELAPTCQVQS